MSLGARQPPGGRELYLEGHVPGASFLDVDDDLSDLSRQGQGRHPPPDAERFAERASRAGVGDGVFVVAYGAMGGAERLWWLLEALRARRLCGADRGLDAWGGLRAGEEDVAPAAFTPRARSGDTIDADEILARRDELVVVDARLAPRWRGEDNPIDKVPGRIPGAQRTVERVPPSVYRAARRSRTAAPASPRPCSCTGSGSPAATLALYPGSWSQWETLGLPVERGDASA